MKGTSNHGVVAALAAQVELPRMALVRQTFADDGLSEREIRETICRELDREAIRNRVRPGMRVAVTCGSRGVANIALILRTVVDWLRSAGACPFIVTAMGSHGGATAEGQLAICESFGVTEAAMGCPIVSSMEVKQVATAPDGTPIYIDRNAAEADGIVVVGRIKPHTGFRGKYESGLMKMMVIGLGKQRGAEMCHLDGFSKMAENIETFGKRILASAPVLFGLATVENARDDTWKLAALTPDEIIEREPAYLLEAKSKLAGLPFSEVDVLIVDRIGKDISGDGMDPNVTGTFCSPYATGGIRAERVVILDLTEASHGCAIGMGMADFTTRRFFDKIDLEESYPNAITSKMVVQAKIPMVLASDEEAIRIALKTCCGIQRRAPRILRIRDTLHLEKFWISEALLEAAKAQGLEIVAPLQPMAFDADGALAQAQSTEN